MSRTVSSILVIFLRFTITWYEMCCRELPLYGRRATSDVWPLESMRFELVYHRKYHWSKVESEVLWSLILHSELCWWGCVKTTWSTANPWPNFIVLLDSNNRSWAPNIIQFFTGYMTICQNVANKRYTREFNKKKLLVYKVNQNAGS